MAIQDIATAKPRQRGFSKKTSRRKELTSFDKTDITSEVKSVEIGQEGSDVRHVELTFDSSLQGDAEKDVAFHEQDLSPEDVPDGAQISKAFDKLCNIVRGRIRGYKKPEPSPEFFTKGRYVLVTGESSYMDPYFYSSTPQAAGRVNVSIIYDVTPEDDIVLPIPELPEPSESSESESDENSSEDPKIGEPEDDSIPKGDTGGKKDTNGGKSEDKEEEEEAKKPPDVIKPDHTPEKQPRNSSSSDSVNRKRSSTGRNNDKEDSGLMSFRGSDLPSSMSYEKVEVVESIEKISDNRTKSYEETAMIVETMIEKTRKK